MSDQFNITWVDSGREPKCAPNPSYPAGIDVDCTAGAMPNCTASLAYPAKRCGIYVVKCMRCGWKCAVTTAGRADDPRSVRVPCKGIVQ